LAKGAWTVTTIAGPSGAASPSLAGLSCPAVGRCTAVGRDANDVSQVWQPIVETLAAGSWTGKRLPLAADAWNERLSSVSCVGPDACVAVGTHTNATRSAEQPLTATQNGATWTAEVLPNAPDVQDADLSGVACLLGGSCWSVGDAITTDGGRRPIAVAQPAPLYVPVHALAVSTSGSRHGTVTASGIACPSSCSHTYSAGTQVRLAAKAAVGATFTGWSGGGCSGTGSCTVTMNSDVAVTAKFLDSIRSTAGGSRTAAYGSSVTLPVRLQDLATGHVVASASVSLWRRPTSSAPWSWLATRRTSSSGSASVKLTAAGTQQFQWRFAGAGSYAASRTAVQILTVAQVVAIHANHRTVRRNHPVDIFGVVHPAGSGQRVYLQRRSGSHWITVASTVLKRQSLPDHSITVGYVFIRKISSKGTFTYRVMKARTRTVTTGVSRSVNLTVT
jgi:hypothetical protein